MRGRILLSLSVLFFLAGLWILNGACAFAMLNMPRAEEVAAYRALFYQRAALGLGCMILGIVMLRLRRRATRPGDTTGDQGRP